MYVNTENVTYFDRFGFAHILKEIKKLIGNKIKQIFIYIDNKYLKKQVYDSIMCGYFCIGFIYFIWKCKSFSVTKRWQNCIVIFAISTENLKNLNNHTYKKKYQFFLLLVVSARMKIKNHLK